jgi:hypothetical protein
MTQEKNTEEQQKEIEKIIGSFVSDHEKQKDDYFKGIYGELFEEEEKHTNYQHEIFTKVTFQVLSINDTEKTVKIPRLVEKNYYIPLPMKADFEKFIGIFDEHLQASLAKASKEIFDKKQT